MLIVTPYLSKLMEEFKLCLKDYIFRNYHVLAEIISRLKIVNLTLLKKHQLSTLVIKPNFSNLGKQIWKLKGQCALTTKTSNYFYIACYFQDCFKIYFCFSTSVNWIHIIWTLLLYFNLPWNTQPQERQIKNGRGN